MRTIVIWDTCEAEIKFFILEGDYRKFNHLYINQGDNSDLLDQLNDLIYDYDGFPKVQLLEEFPLLSINTETYVIVAGCIP